MTRLRVYGATWFCGPREGARRWRRLLVRARNQRVADRAIAPYRAPGPESARIARATAPEELAVGEALTAGAVVWRVEGAQGGAWEPAQAPIDRQRTPARRPGS